MNNMPKIQNKRFVWQGKYLKGFEVSFRNSKGHDILWEAVTRVNCKGIACIVPLTPDGDVILIKQYRAPVESFVIEFPAGLNDKDEPLIDVAMRELTEETGYSADRIEEMCNGPVSSGLSTEHLTVYLATGVVWSGAQNLDDAEDIEVIRLPVKEFYDRLQGLLDKNTCVDLKVYGLFALAMQRYERGSYA